MAFLAGGSFMLIISIWLLTFSNTFINIPTYKMSIRKQVSIQKPTTLIFSFKQYLQATGKTRSFFVQTVQAEAKNYCLKVPVLYYHHIEPLVLAKREGHATLTVDNNIFKSQVKYLLNHHYNPITVDQLIYALNNHTALPPKSIALTFDDGYSDIYTYAFPIFVKYNLPVSLMISPGLIGKKDYLTWKQIEIMEQSGLIYYTDHSWTHQSLKLTPFAKLQSQIMPPKAALEEHTGQLINIYTYPYGEYNKESIATLQKDGFVAAFATRHGGKECSDSLFTLPRIEIGNAQLSLYGL